MRQRAEADLAAARAALEEIAADLRAADVAAAAEAASAAAKRNNLEGQVRFVCRPMFKRNIRRRSICSQSRALALHDYMYLRAAVRTSADSLCPVADGWRVLIDDSLWCRLRC